MLTISPATGGVRGARLVASVAGAASLMLACASPSWALDSVTSTPPSPTTISASGATAIPGATVTDQTNSADVLQVTVSTGLGSLSMPTTGGLTAAYGYSFTGPVISFTGTQSDVNAGLASLQLTGTGTPGTAQVQVTANQQVTVGGQPLAYSPSDDHYYLYVPTTGTSWTTAQAAANASTQLGQEGYLAAIPNQTIKDFVDSHLNGAQNVWAGGHGTDYPAGAPDGAQRVWSWYGQPTPGTAGYGGPLAGTEFTECANVTGNCVFQSTSAFFEGTWNHVVIGATTYQEPNNSGYSAGTSGSGEHALEINYSGGNAMTGPWNDLSDSNTSTSGYVIEYGDRSTGASSYTGRTQSSSDVVIATAPGAPTGVSASSQSPGEAKVAWTAPADDGGSPITGYTVTANGPGGPFTCTTTGTSCTVTGLKSGSYTFTVVAHNVIGSASATPTAPVADTSPQTTTATPTPGCPAATGVLTASRLGPFGLGQTRGSAENALTRFHRRASGYDRFCLVGGVIRLGYPTPRLVHSLTHPQRARYAGRVVIALSANRHYAIDGVRVGDSVKQARRLRLVSFRIGVNTWYVAITRHRTDVLRAIGGRIQEVGIAVHALSSTRARARRLIASFN